jgi:RNA polymerase sigma-70 factor (ECF subfamily)
MSTLMVNAFTSGENDAGAAGNLDEWSDENLIAAAKCGQRAAFGQLCERHAKRVFRVTHRIMRNREDAEDAVQDSLLNAFLHLKDFDRRSQFATWLTRIAINSALMRLRKWREIREISIDEPKPDVEGARGHDVPDSAPNPEEAYRLKERREVVNAAISGLTPGARKVVEFHKLQEHSVSETAQILGISRAAVKTRMYHARATLRRMLQLTAAAPQGEQQDHRRPS